MTMMKNKLIAPLLSAILLGGFTVPCHVAAEDNYKTTEAESASEKKYSVGAEIEKDNVVYLVYKNNEPRLRVKQWNADEEELVIPETVDGIIVDSIGSYSLMKKENLRKVELPNTIRTLGDHAFENCRELRTVNFPPCLEIIDSAAFLGCDNLRRVKLNRCLTEIKVCAFQGCVHINSFSVPGYVDTVGSHVGQALTNAYTLRLCSGVKKVVSEAMLNNYEQKRIIIPPSVETIEPKSLGFKFSSGDYSGTTDAVIYGVSGTEAERYALESGVPFYEFDFRYGDLDNNGKVNAVDASLVLYEYTLRGTGDGKGKLLGASELKADINDDFAIDAVDASIILRYYAESSTGLDYTPEEYFFCS